MAMAMAMGMMMEVWYRAETQKSGGGVVCESAGTYFLFPGIYLLSVRPVERYVCGSPFAGV